jgi:hypothetical protein
MKTNYLVGVGSGDLGSYGASSLATILNTCNGEMRPCLRLSGGLFYIILEYISDFIGSLLYWDITNSPLFFSSSENIEHKPSVAVMKLIVVPSISWFLYVFTIIWGIFFWGQRIFRKFWVGFSFSILVAFAVIGWPPVVVNIFFNFVNIFFDWPEYYFMYSQGYHNYDFMALIYSLVAILYIAEIRIRPVWSLLLMSVWGQLTIEHLGLVFVMAIFLYELSLKSYAVKFTISFSLIRSPLVALVGTLLAILASTLVFIYSDNTLVYEENSSIFQAIGYIFSPDKNIILKNNLGFLSGLIAIYIMFISIPAILGFTFGTIISKWFPIDEMEAYAQMKSYFKASIAFLISLTLALAAGILFLNYPAEMGRQFLSLSAIAPLPFFLLARLVFSQPIYSNVTN